MKDLKRIEISLAVADALNEEAFDGLPGEIAGILKDIEEAERRQLLEEAWVTIVMASQPGCLPDAFTAFSMDEDPEIIHEEILSQMNDGDEDEELDWEAAKTSVASLSLEGDAIASPDGRIIEVIRKNCAQVLRDNGIGI